jgi:hypothetical protein
VARGNNQLCDISRSQTKALTTERRLYINEHVVTAHIVSQSRILPTRSRGSERFIFTGC